MIVESRPVVRHGLRAVLEEQSDMTVVAQAATIEAASALGATPDVIVTELDLSDSGQGHAIDRLRGFAPRSSILVFTQNADQATIHSTLAAGANGYLLETADVIDLVDAIRAVAKGETYLQPSLGVELARSRGHRNGSLGLSPQEERVLGLLALGHTNAEVARLCGVSLRTIEARRAHIQRKLGRRTRAELVAYARETGLFEARV